MPPRDVPAASPGRARAAGRPRQTGAAGRRRRARGPGAASTWDRRRGRAPGGVRRRASDGGARRRPGGPAGDRPSSTSPRSTRALGDAARPGRRSSRAGASGWPPRCVGGGRLLAAGNGGSAAEAQHLTAELVGRYRDERAAALRDRLHAETSSLTAIVNDYGPDEVFARQVRGARAAGRRARAALARRAEQQRARRRRARRASAGLEAWALTGPGPNPLAGACRRGGRRRRAEHRDRAGGASGGDPPAVRGRRRRARGAGHAAGRCVAADDPAVVVVGDGLLDRDVDGRVERVCPDAPAPVVDVDAVARTPRRRGPGRALLARGDGLDVTLVARARPTTPAGASSARCCASAGVRGASTSAATARRRRRSACAPAGQSIVRLDRGGRAGACGGADAGRRPARCARGRRRARSRTTAAASTADADVRARSRRAPARRWCGTPTRAARDPVRGVRARHAEPRRGPRARRRTAPTRAPRPTASRAAARALVGRGGRRDRSARAAPCVATAAGEPLLVPAAPGAAGDTCGAGDRFAGARPRRPSPPGRRPSEAVAAPRWPRRRVRRRRRRRRPAVGAAARRARRPAGRRRGSPPRAAPAAGAVVATGGCFDLLHAGHVAHARGRAGAGRLPGRAASTPTPRCAASRARPAARARRPTAPPCCAALACVDAVVVFDEDDPGAALRAPAPRRLGQGRRLRRRRPARGRRRRAPGAAEVVARALPLRAVDDRA